MNTGIYITQRIIKGKGNFTLRLKIQNLVPYCYNSRRCNLVILIRHDATSNFLTNGLIKR